MPSAEDDDAGEMQVDAAMQPMLAATPPMGWNTWYGFRCTYDERSLRETADAMVASGLLGLGYEYLLIDDCWQTSRDANGVIIADPAKFPSGIKSLADYVHSRGLKLGIYTDVGSKTCQSLPGSLDHEELDASTYASWGIDFIKEDWCFTDGLTASVQYRKMKDAIDRTGRPMVFNICNWGEQSPWEWAPDISQLWRTTGDINDSWAAMIGNFDLSSRHAAVAGPGRWNDPDYLQAGRGGATLEEYKTQVSLWAIAAAPLVLSMDVRRLDPAVAQLVTNPEVLAIDQDPRGVQGTIAVPGTALQVWSKPLEQGSRAVAILNRTTSAMNATVKWSDLGLADGSYLVRDVWNRRDLGTLPSFSASVPAHGTVLIKVTGAEALPPRGDAYASDLRWAYAASGWGPAERDHSNGLDGLDGGTIRLRGQAYTKGIGAHAESRIRIGLGGRCHRFRSDAGIDDEVGAGRGAATFEVWADGQMLYQSQSVTSSSAVLSIDVPLDGKNVLELVVHGNGRDVDFDHVDWANARVSCDP